MRIFSHQDIEPKWQKTWENAKAGRVTEDQDLKDQALYHLVMFPYPSGSGLHVGHVESYAAVDILTRFERMRGKNVLMPMGFDSFGLPAENYAIKTGVHPSETTQTAIATFVEQLKKLGISYDWDRMISTSDPEYYKWTQWIFLKFYENGLAYRAKAAVNWCSGCHTVLANEQVVNGACERCGTEVMQKDLEQWFFRITKYAEELLQDLDQLDWPERIKAMQRNWIGKSEGVEVVFSIAKNESRERLEGEASEPTEHIESLEVEFPVFTTRPDTLYGVSYVVLAPEHPLVDVLADPSVRDAVVSYREAARLKSELERRELQKDKTGLFIGAYAIHPLTGENVPIWIADYVLMNYGAGAVMGVPAHDDRDYVFAKKYDLPIKHVIVPPPGAEAQTSDKAYTEEGIMVDSENYSGLTSREALQQISDELESLGKGKRVTNYRMRDWLVSRQRYWGAPIPIVRCEDCGLVPVKGENLPVLLPTDVDFLPTGESPLVNSKTFHDVACPVCEKPARRESDTMDTFVDSSWYYLRYCDPHNTNTLANTDKVDYWCPVDLYVGGAEHAVLHLLYSRFFAHALKDLGIVSFNEPFPKLRNQGLILGPDGEKMSKSKGNVVNPNEIVSEYGADTIRLYEMFLGPLEDAKPWDTKGLIGVRRFLDKVWTLQDLVSDTSNKESDKAVHKTIIRVTEDLVAMKFNTAISAMMSCVNSIQSAGSVSRESYEVLVCLLAPFAPHLAEEIWQTLGNSESVFAAKWPEANEALLVESVVNIVIQINGKVRGNIEVPADAEKDTIIEMAKVHENVQTHLADKEIQKVVYVPGRLVSFVVSE